jgi:hypothetical protein
MSEIERWVFVDNEGRLILHTENDGHAYLRYGPQATDEHITLEELRARHSDITNQAEICLRNTELAHSAGCPDRTAGR